jgi:hypothetical protein
MQSKAKLGLVMATLLGAACGGSVANQTGGDDAATHPDASSGGHDAAVDAPSKTPDAEAGPSFPYPALLPANPPQVISLGGPVMSAPKIIPVFFATDDPTTTAQIADFVSMVGQTKYWIANVAEYGGGAATGMTPIQLTSADNPPATWDDSNIQAWLANKLDTNDPAFGTPDQNTLYALFYPPGVTITIGGTTVPTGDGGVESGAPDAAADTGGGGGFGGVQSSCTDFGGYHENITLDEAHGGQYVSLAVIPRCATFDMLSGLDVITGAASHEFIEATTDPQPYAIPAYVQVDDPHEYWERVLGGGEVCDMCAQFPTSFTKFSELPYTVQRCWSNKAEKAGTDPCVPELPKEVYFNAYPELTNVTASIEGMTASLVGVDIPVGSSKVVTLDLFSDGPTAPWTVSAEALTGGPSSTSNLTFSFDKTTGQNGDKIQMTILVTAASERNHEEFIVTSTLGTTENIWIGFVAN